MQRLARLIAACILLHALPVLAADATAPLSPEQRFEAARGLMQSGQFIEAANAFRDVAEAPDAPAQLREQALFVCGLMYQNARDYERAIAVYEEVERRFPGTVSAQRAAGSASELRGTTTGLEFRHRIDEAWDQMEAAKELAEREGLTVALPALEHVQGLLMWLLRDYGDNSKAKDISKALAEICMVMQRFEAAQAAYEDAILRARREGNTPALADFIADVEGELAEIVRIQRRQRITHAAMGVLAVIGVAFLCVAPWRIRDARIWHTATTLFAASCALAVLAAVLSYGIRQIDVMSPVNGMQAALLVALPAFVGEMITLGFIGALPQRRVHGVAAAVGVVAAVAVTLCLVNAFALFPFLDSDL